MSEETYQFRLYVTGDAPHSWQAIENLTAICETHLADRYEIEIVDVLLHPERALADQVYMTPMLLSVSPYPGRRIVGTLSQTEPILQILGLGPAQRRDFPGPKDRLSTPQLRGG